MSDKAAGRVARVEVPEAERAVPGSRERKLAIGRDDDILDEVAVSLESTAGKAVVVTLTGELPDDDSLIARRREDHVRVLVRRGERRDPAFVALELAAERKRFRHFVVLVVVVVVEGVVIIILTMLILML